MPRPEQEPESGPEPGQTGPEPGLVPEPEIGRAPDFDPEPATRAAPAPKPRKPESGCGGTWNKRPRWRQGCRNHRGNEQGRKPLIRTLDREFGGDELR